MFTADHGGLRAKEVCQTLSIGTEPKDTEDIRTTLKRQVNQQILTEPQPDLYTLKPDPA